MNILILVMIGVGALLIYAAVKNKNPVEIVKEALANAK